MKNIFLRLLLILVIGLPCNRAFSQVSSEEIDAIVQKAMESFTVAGAAVAVVKDGKIVHQKGYGLTSIDGKAKVDEHTNFGIASNSKAFTTAALALLVEEGKLSWTDKVIDHIPEFKMYNDYVTQNFNIQDLLTHRSGLGLGIGDLMFFPDGSDFTVDDILSSFQHFKPESAFRTKFDYDNLLYIVAGEVIHRVSGKTWEQFISERIFTPLQMDHSFASYTFIKDKSNVASPHLSNDKQITLVEPEQWDPSKLNGAAGGIYSNVNDLANWMLMQLNEGKYGENLEQQLFSEASQREMWKIHTTLNVNINPRYNSHFNGYGLGWFLTDVKGNMMVSHTGGLIGMLSKTVLIPDLDLGIVVLTNTVLDGAGVFSSVTQSILDKYLGLEEFDWNGFYAERLHQSNHEADEIVATIWNTVETADQSMLKLNNYTGIFEDPWFGKIEISQKGEQLWFSSYRSPKVSGPMYYYKANTFVAKWESASLPDADAFVMFQLDEEGKAQSIKMKGISPAIDFSFDFHDLDLHRVSEN
ncbi:serine hydrolase [Echinicola sp. CAU 1574]|uniref:Serine hydrolase n=1 Tax=Echinicola arenosa TaxID=2774144 RepID=A0ABR9ALY2_9BACT|nr:serine hydrolase [Echinicola arenosa]MBD8489700.1 serine hydrolase [Echinicola arenosa]